jgi:surfactin synthase thioesterase subunit
MAPPRSRQIVQLGPHAPRRCRLICIPYAGASASVYARWAAALTAPIELCALELPGHGHRLGEPLNRGVAALVKQFADGLGDALDMPYAFFGHSMGALLCYELTRCLASMGLPLPIKLLLSGFPAPHIRRPPPVTYDLPDREFVAAVQRYDGMEGEILANRELMELILPILRADLCACQTYRYQPGPRLATSVVALGGREDPEASQEELLGWRDLVTGGFSLHMFPGAHFFIRTHENEVLRAIESELDFLWDTGAV